MSKQILLLSIIELGGYPDFTSLYEKVGFDVIQVNSLRQSLTTIRKNPPHVVIAEFIYGPTYGSQLSNFESLFACLQRNAPEAQLIALMDKDNRGHFERLQSRFPASRAIYYPVDEKILEQYLQDIYRTY